MGGPLRLRSSCGGLLVGVSPANPRCNFKHVLHFFYRRTPIPPARHRLPAPFPRLTRIPLLSLFRYSAVSTVGHLLPPASRRPKVAGELAFCPPALRSLSMSRVSPDVPQAITGAGWKDGPKEAVGATLRETRRINRPAKLLPFVNFVVPME